MIMLFKLFNASTIFQAYINKALTDLINIIYVIYLNDILIYNEKFEEHWDHVKQILNYLYQYQLFINLKKCEFAVDLMKFLEFIILITEIIMNEHQINIIQE